MHSPITSGYGKRTRTPVSSSVVWRMAQIAAPSHQVYIPAVLIIEVLYIVFVIFKSASLLFQIAHQDRVGDRVPLSRFHSSLSVYVIIIYANCLDTVYVLQRCACSHVHVRSPVVSSRSFTLPTGALLVVYGFTFSPIL